MVADRAVWAPRVVFVKVVVAVGTVEPELRVQMQRLLRVQKP